MSEQRSELQYTSDGEEDEDFRPRMNQPATGKVQPSLAEPPATAQPAADTGAKSQRPIHLPHRSEVRVLPYIPQVKTSRVARKSGVSRDDHRLDLTQVSPSPGDEQPGNSLFWPIQDGQVAEKRLGAARMQIKNRTTAGKNSADAVGRKIKAKLEEVDGVLGVRVYELPAD